MINDFAPDRDHTSNSQTGSFIYANTLDQPANRTAQLRSARFAAGPGCRVRFYYYMNSATSPGQLSVMLRSQTLGPPTTMWSTSKIVGDYWERQELEFQPGNPYEIIFEAKTLGGGGTIGLDDISFSSQCNTTTTFMPTGTTTQSSGSTVTPSQCTYSCPDGTCIGREKVKIDYTLKTNFSRTKFRCHPCDLPCLLFF